MEIKYDSMLIGNYVILKESVVADAELIHELRTSNAGRFLRQPRNYSVQTQIDWMSSRPKNEVNYIIIDKSTHERVGTIGIYDINFEDKVANVGRLIIKESYLNTSTPYGLEALLLTYNYVFNVLNFRKITGDILASNVEMVKFQVFLGMKQEGYLKQHVNINGEFIDLHIMSLFKIEFESKYQKKINFFLKGFKYI